MFHVKISLNTIQLILTKRMPTMTKSLDSLKDRKSQSLNQGHPVAPSQDQGLRKKRKSESRKKNLSREIL